MKNYFKYFCFILFSICAGIKVSAQDAGSQQGDESQEIDASKPTNFYTTLDNSLEFSQRPNANVFGYRASATFAVSESHLVLAEVPLLYNDATKNFGLGDVRARYFWLPYKNYDKFFGAFGPSLDVFAPTGDVDNGIGSGSWVISPGITMGLMVADWIQVFPIISYQYVSKSNTSLIPEDLKTDANGLTFQAIIPIIISERFFTSVTPIYRLNDFSNEKSGNFVQAFSAVYVLNDKVQLTSFYSNNSKANVNVFRLGATIFL